MPRLHLDDIRARMEAAVRGDEMAALYLPADVAMLLAELKTLREAARVLVKHLDAGSPAVMRDAAAEHLRRLVEG